MCGTTASAQTAQRPVHVGTRHEPREGRVGEGQKAGGRGEPTPVRRVAPATGERGERDCVAISRSTLSRQGNAFTTLASSRFYRRVPRTVFQPCTPESRSFSPSNAMVIFAVTGIGEPEKIDPA